MNAIIRSATYGLHNCLRASRSWSRFSSDYKSIVFSPTSFATQREQILRHVVPGIVAELGCGPLGLLLQDICRLERTVSVGSDFCWEMIQESREQTKSSAVQYLLADNRCLTFKTSSVDTIVSVNSFLPETRGEVDLIFHEVARVLRKGGRLVAVVPAFEMSLVARDRWGMELQLDLHDRREWDTTGWQCFYSVADIEALMRRHQFHCYRVQILTFSASTEIEHIRRVYAHRLERVPRQRLVQDPLFEHLIVAER
jgi:SAM-dependent methyltransferase